MNFLYRLYEQQYFGIILFVMIVTLLLLFLIIFFFGSKDKKNQLEQTIKMELANNKSKNINGFKDIDDSTKELVIPEIEQPGVKIEEKEEIVEDINEQRLVDDSKEKIDIDSLFELPEEKNVIESNKESEEPLFNPIFVENRKEESVPFEMPKLKNEEVKNNDLLQEDIKEENNIFDSFENETYNINR